MRRAAGAESKLTVGETLAFHLSRLGELEPGDDEALAGLEARVEQIAGGVDLLRNGDHPKEVVIVLSGLLQRYSLTPDGGRQIHSFYVATDSPCLETLYLDYMDNHLATLTDSVIGFIPHAPLYRLIGEREGVRKLIFRETLVQGAVFREWLLRNSNMPAHARVAHLFCEMFTRAKAAGLVDGDSFDLPITQQDLADAVGLSPVHANRTLMLLRRTGALEWRRGRVAIGDFDGLREVAGFDPYYLHLRDQVRS